MDRSCTIVIATFNRRDRLSATLDRLHALPESPSIIVVDNASTDGTHQHVLRHHPNTRVVLMESNIGAAARNVGAHLATTRYIAFCDDDCWWQPGSLSRACALLDEHDGVGLVNARIMVDGVIDDVCRLMAESRVPKRTQYPGTAIAAFMACSFIARRSAFLEAGGFHRRFHIGAEESLLAIDLLDRKWELIYDEELVVHHQPYQAGRDPRKRRVTVMRNRLWTVWLRRSRPAIASATLAALGKALQNPESLQALLSAVGGIAWIARERRRVDPRAEYLAGFVAELPP